MSPRGFDAGPDDAGSDRTDAGADASGATDPTDSGTDARPERLLAAVQDAALERALVDDADAARHLALAGGLERARRVAAEEDTPRRAGPFGPALLAVTTLAAFDAREGRESGELTRANPPASPPQTVSPEHSAVDPGPTDASEPVVEGAALAVRRFDADVRRAAALADVPVATLARRIESVPEHR